MNSYGRRYSVYAVGYLTDRNVPPTSTPSQTQRVLNLRKKRTLSHSSSEDVRAIKKSPDHESAHKSYTGGRAGNPQNSASSSIYRRRGASGHASATISRPPSTQYTQYSYNCDSNGIDPQPETANTFGHEHCVSVDESPSSEPSTSHHCQKPSISPSQSLVPGHSTEHVQLENSFWREQSLPRSNDSVDISFDTNIELLRHDMSCDADDERGAETFSTLANNTNLSSADGDEPPSASGGEAPTDGTNTSLSHSPSSPISNVSSSVVSGKSQDIERVGSENEAVASASPTLELETRRVRNIRLEGALDGNITAANDQLEATATDCGSEVLAVSSEITIEPEVVLEPNTSLMTLPSDIGNHAEHDLRPQLPVDSEDSDLELVSVEPAR